MHSDSAPPLNFRKSSYSQGTTENCVEVADLPGASAVRDTQHRHLGQLMFPSAEWQAAMATISRDS
ncbi:MULTISPECIES: DUF397 domain-containing protein [unclassified Nocardiopsis]|uniref:DUF397 domain-containing protein n=1 Tax=Nocardiopsis TaxID=2013 RepID=UPI00387AD492